MRRLFLALRPPPPIRAMLAGVMHGISGARWQDDDRLHLTIRYIGDVDVSQAEDVAAAIDGLRTPQVTVAVDGIGRFGGDGRRGGASLWAGLAPAEPLAALHRKADHALVRAGLPPEGRAYLPHITLARFSRTQATSPEIDGWCARHAGLSSAPFTCTHLTLFESVPGADGVKYDALARWPLTD